MCNVADYNDEGVIRLGEKCIEDLTNEYLARHNGNDLESYRRYLRRFLPNSWLRTVVDPDELIDCMEREYGKRSYEMIHNTEQSTTTKRR